MYLKTVPPFCALSTYVITVFHATCVICIILRRFLHSSFAVLICSNILVSGQLSSLYVFYVVCSQLFLKSYAIVRDLYKMHICSFQQPFHLCPRMTNGLFTHVPPMYIYVTCTVHVTLHLIHKLLMSCILTAQQSHKVHE